MSVSDVEFNIFGAKQQVIIYYKFIFLVAVEKLPTYSLLN